MITLGVLAVVIALGVPSFNEAMERRQVQGAVDDLHLRLQTAKAEAIKRNQNIAVAFTRTSASQWCVGMRNDTTAACNCTVTDSTANNYCGFDDDGAGAAPRIGQILSVGTGDGVELSDPAVFGGDAVFAIDPIRSTIVGLETGDLFLDSENYRVRIRVLPTGTVGVCDAGPAASKSRMGRYPLCA